MTNSVSRAVSDETLSRIIQIESSGNPSIKAATSSALGLGQFLKGTWLAVVKKHRPDLLVGRSLSQVLALRLDPKISIEMLARFTEDNIAIIGKGATDGDIYLAHFSGAGTAKKLFVADPSDAASRHFDPAAVKANESILRGKTVGEVRAWAERKMSKAGGHGWVEKFGPYPNRATPVPVMSIDDADDDVQPAKVDLPIPTAPSPALGSTQDGRIEAVQKRLKALGYHEVGEPDGLWGGKTAGAIAAFKNDRHIAGAPVIEDALMRELDRAEAEKWTRPISVERAEAKPEVVAQKIETVAAGNQNKLWAWLMGIGGSIVAFVKGVVDQFEAALESPWLNHVKEFAADNMAILALGVVAIAVAIWWNGQKTVSATTKAYQEGRLQ